MQSVDSMVTSSLAKPVPNDTLGRITLGQGDLRPLSQCRLRGLDNALLLLGRHRPPRTRAGQCDSSDGREPTMRGQPQHRQYYTKPEPFK